MTVDAWVYFLMKLINCFSEIRQIKKLNVHLMDGWLLLTPQPELFEKFPRRPSANSIDSTAIGTAISTASVSDVAGVGTCKLLKQMYDFDCWRSCSAHQFCKADS